jgi:LacI family transcriptional regulator
MAIGAMKAIREERLEIPGDIAVMGFDDIFAASVVTPGLSTINQFQETLGRVAAKIVLQRLNDLPGDIVKCRSSSSYANPREGTECGMTPN